MEPFGLLDQLIGGQHTHTLDINNFELPAFTVNSVFWLNATHNENSTGWTEHRRTLEEEKRVSVLSPPVDWQW